MPLLTAPERSEIVEEWSGAEEPEAKSYVHEAFELQAARRPHAVAVVQTKYDTQHCQLQLQLPGTLPTIQADHDALVTVLVNLLDNACKYTGDNKQVSLQISTTDHAVRFVVTDNGIGIARRHLRKIFDRFYQVDNSLARKAEGCGLGLSIVQSIVRLHGGGIEVESQPELGSTFRVTFPLWEPGANPAAAESELRTRK